MDISTSLTVLLLRSVTRSSVTSLDATATSRQPELQWRRCRVKTRAQHFAREQVHMYTVHYIYVYVSHTERDDERSICFRIINVCIPQFCHANILGNDSCLRPAGALSLLGLVKSSQFRSQTPETLDGRSCLIQAVS